MSQVKEKTYYVGSGLGSVLAVGLSYHINHSIGWAILHFFCGWCYNVYWLFEYTNVIERMLGR